MAKITIANGAAGAVIRAALNDMFTELYAKFVAATAEADGYLKKEDFATFLAKQDALGEADVDTDGILTKEDWATFNGKQAALSAATAEADGYLTKEDFATFLAKQDALSAATAAVDGYLKKEDFDTFNKKQAALTDPVTLAAGAPATAGAAGVKGQIFVDGTDIYVCTATNTWIKGALTLDTWGEE